MYIRHVSWSRRWQPSGAGLAKRPSTGGDATGTATGPAAPPALAPQVLAPPAAPPGPPRRSQPSAPTWKFPSIDRQRNHHPLQLQSVGVGARRGPGPNQQANEVVRRGRQLRERRRADAQRAERARKARARAARSPAAPSRRRAARRPGRAAPAPRAAAAGATRRAAQGLAAVARARLAEPTARPAGANGLSSGRRAVGSGDPDAGAWAALGRPRGLAAAS